MEEAIKGTAIKTGNKPLEASPKVIWVSEFTLSTLRIRIELRVKWENIGYPHGRLLDYRRLAWDRIIQLGAGSGEGRCQVSLASENCSMRIACHTAYLNLVGIRIIFTHFSSLVIPRFTRKRSNKEPCVLWHALSIAHGSPKSQFISHRKLFILYIILPTYE